MKRGGGASANAAAAPSTKNYSASLSFGDATGLQSVTVPVGVSSDVLFMDFRKPGVRIWVPMDQAPRRVTYLMRASGDASALSGEVRASIAATAPSIPIENMETFAQGVTRARSSDDVIIAVLVVRPQGIMGEWRQDRA